MNNKLARALWGATALLGLVTAFTAFNIHHGQTHFTCQNKNTMFNKEGILVSDNVFEFAGGRGKYSSTGTYSDLNHAEKTVDNAFEFYFWSSDKKLFIVANEESHHSAAYETIPIFLPDVMFHRDMAIALSLVKINPQTYLFLRDDFPVFLCKKTSSPFI